MTENTKKQPALSDIEPTLSARERAMKRFDERRAAGIPIGGPDNRKKPRRKSEAG